MLLFFAPLCMCWNNVFQLLLKLLWNPGAVGEGQLGNYHFCHCPRRTDGRFLPENPRKPCKSGSEIFQTVCQSLY